MEKWALPEIDLERCTQCGRCVERCPADAVAMVKGWPSIVRPADCNYCTDCETVCDEGAITCTFGIVWGETDS
jgi:MinD superfamily P-loop ATPase